MSTSAICAGPESSASRPARPSRATRTRCPASSSSLRSVSAASALSSTMRTSRAVAGFTSIPSSGDCTGAATAGRRTVNEAPLPGPSLAAVARRVALDEELEGASAQLLGHAHSGVAHSEDGVVACLADAYADRPAGGGELERVSDEVRDDLLDPRFVGVDPDRIQAALEAMGAETAGGLENGERTRHHGGQVDRAALEHDLAHHRAPGVEQIVGEPREMLHLSRDDGARLPRRFRIDPRMVEQVARVGDRAER